MHRSGFISTAGDKRIQLVRVLEQQRRAAAWPELLCGRSPFPEGRSPKGHFRQGRAVTVKAASGRDRKL